MVIVGITGFKRSGKSTLAKYLAEEFRNHGTLPLCHNYATMLKRIVIHGILPESGSQTDMEAIDEQLKNSTTLLTDEQATKLVNAVNSFCRLMELDGLSQEEAGRLLALANKPLCDAYRQALQIVGTDIIRKRDNYFWVKQMMAVITTLELVGEPLAKAWKYKDLALIIADIRFPNEAELVKNKGGWIVKIARKQLRLQDRHPSETMVQYIKPDLEFVVDEGLEHVREVAQKVFQHVTASKQTSEITQQNDETSNLHQTKARRQRCLRLK